MLVSTIIPAFNRANEIVFTIESALSQTYPHQEILVCDDGSTDDTAQVVGRFGGRVRHLWKPNGGASSARNLGIEHARGDLIAFLDSDDEWLPTKLAAQVRVFETRPAIDMVLTGIIEMDGTRTNTGLVLNRRSTLPEDGHILRHVLRNPAMCPSTAMVRTGVARAVRGFDTSLRTAEDLDFHLRVALRHQIAVVEEPLTRYLRAPGSLGNELRSYYDYVFVVERFLREHGAEVLPEDRHAALLLTYVRNSAGLAYSGDLRGAAGFGWRGLMHARRPSDLRAIVRLAAILTRHAIRHGLSKPSS